MSAATTSDTAVDPKADPATVWPRSTVSHGRRRVREVVHRMGGEASTGNARRARVWDR
jgi:hypothetical protein